MTLRSFFRSLTTALLALVAITAMPLTSVTAQTAPAPTAARASAPAAMPASLPTATNVVPPASAGPAPVAMPQTVPATGASLAPAATAQGDGYSICVGDVVDVGVLGRPDYQARVQVQVDGTIQLPLINDIAAANRTVLQLRNDIKTKLIAGGFFTDTAAVAVNVTSFASRYVTVLGEVGTPGLVPIDRTYRLSEIIARVGGVRPDASDDIILTRAEGASTTLNLVQVATGNDAQNPIVNAGDRIFIAIAPQFYIYGQVNSPGSYRIDRGMSLRMALARGGGLTAQGSERRVKVIRGGVELRGVDPNAPIQPGDTIVVGERFF